MNHLEQLVAETTTSFELQFQSALVTKVVSKANSTSSLTNLLSTTSYTLNAPWTHSQCQNGKPSLSLSSTEGVSTSTDVFRKVSGDLDLHEPEQIVVLQLQAEVREIGGARLVTVREFVHEVYEGLKGKTPQSKAVPSNLPLLRILQPPPTQQRPPLRSIALFGRTDLFRGMLVWP